MAAALQGRCDGEVEQVHLVDPGHRDEIADQPIVLVDQQLRVVAGMQRIDEIAAAPRKRRRPPARARAPGPGRRAASPGSVRLRAQHGGIHAAALRGPDRRRARRSSARPCRADRAAAPAQRRARRHPARPRTRAAPVPRPGCRRGVGSACRAPATSRREPKTVSAEPASSGGAPPDMRPASRQASFSAPSAYSAGASSTCQCPAASARPLPAIGRRIDLVHARILCHQHPIGCRPSSKALRTVSATSIRLSTGSTGRPVP